MGHFPWRTVTNNHRIVDFLGKSIHKSTTATILGVAKWSYVMTCHDLSGLTSGITDVTFKSWKLYMWYRFWNFCFEPQAWYDFLQQTAAKFWWASVLQMGQHMSTYSACPKWCKLNLPRQSDNQLSCHGVSCQSVCLANRETSRPRFLPIGHFLDWSLFVCQTPPSFGGDQRILFHQVVALLQCIPCTSSFGLA